ncbi:hypothetical protein BHE74_00026585 [Ensete ventricosum]|nr:hypothetical protein GW17_00034797 [Ensete ventricosum]RWW66066.1 hypothetical protein BHE74_00026585 [Ensete ventricosum]
MWATSSLQYLTCRQQPTGHYWLVDLSRWLCHAAVACCQGCCRLVGPSRWLYHAVSRLLSGALQADRLVALALPCR